MINEQNTIKKSRLIDYEDKDEDDNDINWNEEEEEEEAEEEEDENNDEDNQDNNTIKTISAIKIETPSNKSKKYYNDEQNSPYFRRFNTKDSQQEESQNKSINLTTENNNNEFTDIDLMAMIRNESKAKEEKGLDENHIIPVIEKPKPKTSIKLQEILRKEKEIKKTRNENKVYTNYNIPNKCELKDDLNDWNLYKNNNIVLLPGAKSAIPSKEMKIENLLLKVKPNKENSKEIKGNKKQSNVKDSSSPPKEDKNIFDKLSIMYTPNKVNEKKEINDKEIIFSDVNGFEKLKIKQKYISKTKIERDKVNDIIGTVNNEVLNYFKPVNDIHTNINTNNKLEITNISIPHNKITTHNKNFSDKNKQHNNKSNNIFSINDKTDEFELQLNKTVINNGVKKIKNEQNNKEPQLINNISTVIINDKLIKKGSLANDFVDDWI